MDGSGVGHDARSVNDVNGSRPLAWRVSVNSPTFEIGQMSASRNEMYKTKIRIQDVNFPSWRTEFRWH